MSRTTFVSFPSATLAMVSATTLCAASCTGGSETGNPVRGFSSSDCHPPRAAIAKGGDAGAPGPQADPLQCFTWELDDDGVLSLEVTNLHSGCEAHWNESSGEWDGGGLRLEIENASCDAPAACVDGCAYDLSFEIVGIEPGEALPIALWKRHTCDDAERDVELTLPLDREPQGMLCQERVPGLWGAIR